MLRNSQFGHFDIDSIFFHFIIWLAPWAGKMNQSLRCDWLPDRARWSYFSRSGLSTVYRKKNFPKSRMINPLLTKPVRSRWLDIGLALFSVSLWTSTLSRSINTQKKNLEISSHLDLTRTPYCTLFRQQFSTKTHTKCTWTVVNGFISM